MSRTSHTWRNWKNSGCVRGSLHLVIGVRADAEENDSSRHLLALDHSQANNNMIEDLEQVRGQLHDKENLETVYLEGNPLQPKLGVHYRRKVMLALPQVRQIDAT